MVCDLERDRVLHVADAHTEASLAEFYELLGPARCGEVTVVAIDMWRAYIAATRQFVPGADRKIAFDKVHVVRLLVDAVDRVRRAENRSLRARGDDRLVRTRYWWLMNRKRLDRRWQQAVAPRRREGSPV